MSHYQIFNQDKCESCGNYFTPTFQFGLFYCKDCQTKVNKKKNRELVESVDTTRLVKEKKK